MFKKRKRKKKKILELRQSTKIPLEITVFHSQTLYELWPWRSKLSFLTSSKALQLWKLFFRTVSILWVDKSQKCCWIEDIDSKLTVFRILKFSTNCDTFWLLVLIINNNKNESKMLNWLCGSHKCREFSRFPLQRSKFSFSWN